MLPKSWFDSALSPEIVDIQSLNPTRTRRNIPKWDAYTTGTPNSLVVSPYGLGKSSYSNVYFRVDFGLASTWVARRESVKR
jgi:hypothetical protein